MKVYSSFNQNISYEHLLKIPFSMFISLKNKNKELISLDAKLAYAIRDDIPVMLAEEARTISQEEIESLKG